MGYTFCRTCLAEIFTAKRIDPLGTVRVATADWPEYLKFVSRHRADILSDNIINKNLKNIANRLFGSKSLFFV